MTEFIGILADLDLCVGCYACEIACKQENNVPVGTRWIKVFTIGPKKTNGKIRMEFLPIMTDRCTLCANRLNKGMEPRCVDSCPVKALVVCRRDEDILSLLQSGKRYQVAKLKGEALAFG